MLADPERQMNICSFKFQFMAVHTLKGGSELRVTMNKRSSETKFDLDPWSLSYF